VTQPVAPAPLARPAESTERPSRGPPVYGCTRYIDEAPANYVLVALPGEDSASCMIRRHCSACHSGSTDAECAAGICYSIDLDELIARGDIVPGDPNASPLYRAVASGSMPPPGVTPALTDDEVQDIAQFILGLPPAEVEPAGSGDGGLGALR
jgi:hypothetical protein